MDEVLLATCCKDQEYFLVLITYSPPKTIFYETVFRLKIEHAGKFIKKLKTFQDKISTTKLLYKG